MVLGGTSYLPFTKQVNPQKVTVIFIFVLTVAKRRLHWEQSVISLDFMLARSRALNN